MNKELMDAWTKVCNCRFELVVVELKVRKAELYLAEVIEDARFQEVSRLRSLDEPESK